MRIFEELLALLTTDPEGYRREVARLRIEDPERFRAFVLHTKDILENAVAEDDRPLTPAEVERLTNDIQRDLGWSRERVIAEAVVRLWTHLEEMKNASFQPMTPEETPAKRHAAGVRRYSSIQALVLGDEHRRADRR